MRSHPSITSHPLRSYIAFQEVKSHIEEFYGQISNTTLQNYLRMMAVR